MSKPTEYRCPVFVDHRGDLGVAPSLGAKGDGQLDPVLPSLLRSIYPGIEIVDAPEVAGADAFWVSATRTKGSDPASGVEEVEKTGWMVRLAGYQDNGRQVFVAWPSPSPAHVLELIHTCVQAAYGQKRDDARRVGGDASQAS